MVVIVMMWSLTSSALMKDRTFDIPFCHYRRLVTPPIPPRACTIVLQARYF
eukprot:gene9083-8198_t